MDISIKINSRHQQKKCLLFLFFSHIYWTIFLVEVDDMPMLCDLLCQLEAKIRNKSASKYTVPRKKRDLLFKISGKHTVYPN